MNWDAEGGDKLMAAVVGIEAGLGVKVAVLEDTEFDLQGVLERAEHEDTVAGILWVSPADVHVFVADGNQVHGDAAFQPANGGNNSQSHLEAVGFESEYFSFLAECFLSLAPVSPWHSSLHQNLASTHQPKINIINI